MRIVRFITGLLRNSTEYVCLSLRDKKSPVNVLVCEYFFVT